MHFDERILLVEQVHRGFMKPPKTALLDGPLWWLGPIAVFAALAAAMVAIPWPEAAPPPPPTQPCADVIASRSAVLSRN